MCEYKQDTRRALELYDRYKTETEEYAEIAKRLGTSTAKLNARCWEINRQKREELKR